MKAEELKQVVREKYGEIADKSILMQEQSCCSPDSCCNDLDISMIGDEYKDVTGYFKDADLGLGCGIPTQFANIKPGKHVLDLGSGAGNDCFVARSIVGEKGKVTGLDFTDKMIIKAIENNKKLGYKNVEFIKGDIEEMPLPDNNFDTILSNCVLNLVPNKNKAFSEIYRVLKKGGHFCVSDVVTKGVLPQKIREDMEMYVGCVSGAIDKEEYLGIIKSQGFENIEVHKEKKNDIPENLLSKYLTTQEIKDYTNQENGIYNITVSATKK